mmetsp:Transcript_39384/g.111611  ORF Transcript_39384/g.111611 Transcript_39384/m.111611 type:complete len:951 (-) Transcript_39384:233-3085(-)|eukprot:CAMPEP_0117663476 /NCGR_PEP_ID=MMETSP0804-20121206/8629_1 /TAXON_ID=1074897 /ORGANISM="Tetraselmis astigmatica, Strain CCMP880" /LENGTH=950 /DNA_ID=CAMNT_0005470489 /DNA_START=142 /DNA_END=2994 /DNA_ORIENTATION=-
MSRSTAGGSGAAAPSGRNAVSHSKEFADLIKSVGECRSKQEEDRIMVQEVSALKKVFQSPNLDKAKLREYLLRLVYVEMLGHDASFAYIHVVNACSDKNWVMKKLGYLATTLFLSEDSEYIIMLVNTIMKDLRDDNYLVVCSGLHAVCRLINNDTIEGFLPPVTNLLKHPKEIVKKKAVMALHRFLQIRPSLREDLDKPLRTALCDKDPSVMSASLCALYEVIQEDPTGYRNLTPSFVSILKQVAEHRLPKSYDYHKTPAPFIQIKILKILALLGVDDKVSSEHMYNVLGDVMRRSTTGHTIGNAVVYECVRTITAAYPNATLLQSAAEMVSTFLRSSSHNLKYIGIDSLAAVVAINPKYAQEQQMAVIDCLEDPDESLKRKTLELLYKMTKPNNVEVIVERMLNYLGCTTDPHNKAETSSRIAELAERYAPDNLWFIEVMNDVFKLGGDAVPLSLGTNTMRIIAEGAGEDDQAADSQLRSNAVQSYLTLLDLPKISEVLLKVIFWVLGEYGPLYAPQGASGVIGKLVAVLDQQTVSDSSRGYLLSALGKICCQTGASLTRDAEAFVRSAASSRNADLQQRALEIQALCSYEKSTQQAALPPDASCEDIEIDPDVPFLSGYVEAALQAGAAPYISQEARDEMGTVRDSRDGGGGAGLRFEAYETAAPPEVFSAPLEPAAPVATSSSVPHSTAVAPPGPQLRISGPRKWGPAYFEAPKPPPQLAQASADASSFEAAAGPSLGSSSGEPDDRAKLASALFGGTSESGGRRRSSARPQQGAPVAAAPTQAPAPTMDLLLDLDHATPSQPAAPAAEAVGSSPLDLLSELSDLSVNPAPAPQPASQPIDPLAVFGADMLMPTAPQTQMPFGFAPGAAPGAPPHQPLVHPSHTMMGGMEQQAPHMMPAGSPQAGVPMMGSAAAAPRPAGPSAASSKPACAKLGEKPKQDPFADLLM